MSWICPQCNEPLASAGGSLVCVHGHSFDVAREGYVNLLAGGRPQKITGDTKAMLQARRRFLDGGHYGPLRDRLMAIATGLNNRVILETGCGEGYYIGGISEQQISSKCLASDIAKDGVRMAAHRYKQVAFAVADTHQKLPLMDSAADVIIDVFAPRNAAEFWRVLQDNGRLVIVIPEQAHLAELAQWLPLSVQPEKREAVMRTLAGRFELIDEEALVIPMLLDEGALMDLVLMTPNAWFADEQKLQELAEAAPVGVTAQFRILTFARLAY